MTKARDLKKWEQEKVECSKQYNLPDEIYNKVVIQKYLKENDGAVWGYLGHERRTRNTDKWVVEILQSNGFSNNDIARFLTSQAARHTMDDVDTASEKKFKEMVLKDAQDWR